MYQKEKCFANVDDDENIKRKRKTYEIRAYKGKFKQTVFQCCGKSSKKLSK